MRGRRVGRVRRRAGRVAACGIPAGALVRGEGGRWREGEEVLLRLGCMLRVDGVLMRIAAKERGLRGLSERRLRGEAAGMVLGSGGGVRAPSWLLVSGCGELAMRLMSSRFLPRLGT